MNVLRLEPTERLGTQTGVERNRRQGAISQRPMSRDGGRERLLFLDGEVACAETTSVST